MNLLRQSYLQSPSPLWLRIFFALILTLAIVAYAATQMGLEDRKNELESTLKEQSWRTLQVLSAGALEPVISEDIELLDTMVIESVRLDPDLHFISIYNESGIALALWTNPDAGKNQETYTYEIDIELEGEIFGKIVAAWNPARLLEQITENLLHERNRLISALLTLTALSLLLLHWLVVAPLNKLRNRLETLSQGVQSEALELKSSREIAMLAQAVNDLDRSIEESKVLSTELEYQAKHDSLTGLLNRYSFETKMKAHLASRKLDHPEATLLYIDLDQFKLVNDTCGHAAGDALLIQISTNLKAQLDDDILFARLGGDEFVVLLTDTSLQNGLRTAERLRLAAQSFRFSWEGKSFAVEASIGAVPIIHQEETFERLLSTADEACYTAKNEGRNRVHCYLEDDEKLRERRDQGNWIPRLIEAIEHSRLVLYAQPIEPTDHRVEQGGHIEILLRLLTDSNEVIPPGAFLPAAERYGLMPQIDKYVITHTIDWLATQLITETAPPVCAINISGHSIGDPNFREFVVDTLQDNTQLSCYLSFEMTETAAVSNLTSAINFMQEVNQLGCSFALDDFGAGMSSFTYLKNLPVQYVKIDGSFVQNILNDRASLAMVRAISDIAHIMDIKTIAEYVENQAIREKLLELDIDYVQGYGIAKPASLICYEAQSAARGQ